MNGIINLLKPPGMTSSGAVVFLRRLLGEKKVGHTGTLDPGAAGVLPICLGRATRLSDYIMSHKKTYLAEAVFGIATDTLDSYGAVTERKDCLITAKALEETAHGFLGEIMQVPPLYSAVKIDGRKSYELARKGMAVRKPPRKVTIYGIELVAQTGANRFLLRIQCSKGTYIRTLAYDIGQAMGVPASLSFLLRERTGGYHIGDSFTIDEIKEMTEKGNMGFMQSPESALVDMEAVWEGPEARFALEHGQIVSTGKTAEGEMFRVYCEDQFFGIGRQCEGGYKLQIPLY